MNILSLVLAGMLTSSNVLASIGAASSTLFIIQIAIQVKIYGIRTWLHFGVGTGVEPQEARKREGEMRKLKSEVRKLDNGLKACAKKCEEDIEDWI